MSFMKELQQLTDKTLVLASTERVARYLKLQAALLQSVSGKRTWFAKGEIKTVSAWLENAWQELMPDEQLLFPVQELAVVKSIADRSGLLPDTQISSTSTARRINQAYSLVNKFQLPMDRDRFAFKKEFECFFAWYEMIKAESDKNGYVFRSEIPRRLLDAIQQGRIEVPERIVIVGIISMNPAERSVFEALQERGAELIEYAEPEFTAVPSLVRANTQADEFSKIATWVNDTLKPYTATPHAAPSVAILVPEMRTYQAPLVEALTLVVSPSSLLPSQDGQEAREPWDISSGATLGSRPMIRAAMDILSITSHKADSETFSRVLRSRWVGGSDHEWASRATMDVWLRDNTGLSMAGKDFRRALTKNGQAGCPDFLKRLDALLDAQDAITAGLYPSEWAEQYEEMLKLMGWPETRELSSANYQTLNAWAEALAMFRTLDYQLGPCEYERAFMWLREIVDTRQFQPRISHVAPVSIMSYEDAIGLTFDKVWVVGASNSALPLPAEPNPFIPVDLQAAAGIPESSSELSLARAQKIAAALLSTSQVVNVSCPAHSDSGSSIGPSELMGTWPKTENSANEPGSFVQTQINLLDRTQVISEVVPPVTQDELSTVKGGVRIFQDYAEAPFFSFARNRLGATEFPVPVIGLDPRIQGTMLHLVLELFWKEVKTSQNLKAQTQETRHTLVKAKVVEASDKLLNRLTWRYGNRLIALEQKRLVELVMDWMAYQATRTLEFEVVATEEGHDIEVGGIPLSIKLDYRERVYATEEAWYTMLSDYKSGKESRHTGLNADRLLEPQLPIYATHISPEKIGEKSVDGITLAQVNIQNISMHTRSSFSAALVERKAKNSDVDSELAWESQCNAWKQALDDMSYGFMQGNATLSDPGKAFPMGYEFLAPLTR